MSDDVARLIAETEAELAATRARLLALDRERCELLKHMPRGGDFVCVCGVVGDPFDSEFERIHRPHVFVAGLDKLTR